jgi:hypothetical protein
MTAEEIISVQSTLARVSLVEIRKGDIDKEKLSNLQRDSELLPHAMSSYIHWVRENVDYIREQFSTDFPKLRHKANQTGRLNHLKLCEQVAFMQFSIDIVTDWVYQKGVFNAEEVSNLKNEAWEIFMENAESLDKRLFEEEPVERFREIITTLITQLKVRLEEKDQFSYRGIGDDGADLLGFYDENFVYFLPTALWNTLQKFCRNEGTHFPCSKYTLYKHLRDKRWIESRGGSNTVTCRIKDESIRVLKMYREKILPEKLDDLTEVEEFLKQFPS